MKILAVHKDSRGYVSGCVADLSRSELAAILGQEAVEAPYSNRIFPGAIATVVERVARVSAIEERVQDTQNVVKQLRVFADMIETAIPSLQEMVDVKEGGDTP